jgi:hypothetical protein
VLKKLSGFNKPSLANAAAFTRAAEDVAAVARTLIDSLSTTSPPRDRQIEAEKARALARPGGRIRLSCRAWSPHERQRIVVCRAGVG